MNGSIWLTALLCFASAATAEEPTAVVVAGTGAATSAGDGGPASAAAVNEPFGVAVAPDGAVLICEVGGHRVRRVDPDSGVITTVVGTGRAGSDGDGGPATAARLTEPYEIAFDARGRWLIVDMQAHVLRRVDPTTGRIETLAGTGEAGFSGDGGPAIQAKLNRPHSVAVANDGTILLCDIGNHRVRAIDPISGVIRTLAGDGKKRGPADGAPFTPQTSLAGPRAIAVAKGEAGEPADWWLALREGNALFCVSPDARGGTGRTLHHAAGTGSSGYAGDGGPAIAASLAGPKGVAVAPNGDVALADTENHAVRVLDARDGTLRTVLGRDADGALRGGFELARPHGVAVAPDGSILVGDSENHRVLRLPPPSR